MLVAAGGAQVPLHAQTPDSPNLGDAIKAALVYSPTMAIARSRLDGSQAEIVMARAEGLPSVDATLQYNRDLADSGQYDRGLRAETAVSLPLYRGGSVHNDIRASKARRDAAGTRIEEAEAEVVLSVSQAYADVLKHRKIVALNRENVANLEKMLAGVEQRLKARDLTRTDLDQAQSRLQLARGRLETAIASLEASQVEYRRLTGMHPGNLRPFPIVEGLPRDADDAVAIALDNNPALRAARVDARSSRFSLQSARGALLPQVYATVNSSYAPSPAQAAPGNREQFGTRVGISMRMGLFQGGARSAGVQIAAANASQADQRVIDLERMIEASTRATFAEWMAARTLVDASRNAVAANEKALSGVRLENAVGTRTILDILNAEQELRDSQEQLASAERDVSVAGMAILATIGKGRPEQLELREALGAQGDGSPQETAASPVATTHNAPSRDKLSGVLPPPPASAAQTLPASPGAERPVSPQPAVPTPAPAQGAPSTTAATSATGQPGASSPVRAPGRQWVVQAGSFDTLPLAISHWQRIGKAGPEAGQAITPGAYRTVISGRAWFRLAASGFADWNEAQTFCLALKRQGLDCLVRRSNGLGEPVWRGPQPLRNAP